MAVGATWRRRTVVAGLAAAGLGATSNRASGQARDVIVETSAGRLRGISRDGVQVFKGVPYAASTGGANRFLPPQPVRPWAGVRDARAAGHSAPQGNLDAPERIAFAKIEPISEDCLFLNVFTPRTGAGRRPVMVWLHGGAWGFGAGSAPGLDGANLAKLGDVVVVTINHRLGVFGYLKLEDSDLRFADSGAAGVLDMIAALQWVRDNAAAFGGDPNNVTIFGQSGGGAKVTALMAAPAAKGLFHRAIAQSCSGSLRITGEEEAAASARALAGQLGLSRLTGEALQAVPMEKILGAARGGFRPVLDGRTFLRHPFDPDAPPASAGIPFMAGNTETETRIQIARADKNNFAIDAAELKRRLSRFFRIEAPETQRIIDAYSAAYPAASPGDLLAAVTTDYVYIRNTRRGADLQSVQAPTYSYLFARRTPVMNGLLRVPHESEVAFIFGTTPAAVDMVGEGADLLPLTKIMIATWSAFARRGDPNNPALPRWPRHDAQEGLSMVLNVSSRVEKNPGGEARKALDGLPFNEYSMSANYLRP